jgi:hypothetical protein
MRRLGASFAVIMFNAVIANGDWPDDAVIARVRGHVLPP